MQKYISSSEHIQVIEELGHKGKAAFQSCLENGLEGVVGKRLSSIYQSNRRSTDWLKIKALLPTNLLFVAIHKALVVAKILLVL